MSSGKIRVDATAANIHASALKVDCNASAPPTKNASTTYAENALVNCTSDLFNRRNDLSDMIATDADAIRKIVFEVENTDTQVVKIMTSF